MLGRFHELSVPTEDIRGSIAFYEQLGFVQAHTGDAWPHPYAVVTDGRIALGLHQSPHWQASLTYVHERIARRAEQLEASGLQLEFAHITDDRFNELGLLAPSGQLIRLVEARTYSPGGMPAEASRCGSFAHLSLPVVDAHAAREFWESLGFVALEPCAHPYPHLPLTSDHLNIAFHEPRIARAPMLVFEDSAASARLEAPEGTLLLLAENE